MLTYKNLYCSLVRSMSEAIDLYDAGKGILAREGLKKPCWTQKTKSFPTTSSPTNPAAAPTQQKTKQRGERSNAAPAEESAAGPPSLAPHDSKARLLNETTRRDSWRSHVHRT